MVCATEVLPVEMSVNLGGGDIGVPEHFLNRKQVCSSLQEMSRARVAQGMRRHGTLDPRALCSRARQWSTRSCG